MLGIATIWKDLRRLKKNADVLEALGVGEIGLQVFYN